MRTFQELIEIYGKKIVVKRKTIISQPDAVEKYIYWIHKGLVRMYTFNENHKEYTFDFVSEENFTNAFESYKNQTPSKIVVETVTDCELYRFGRKSFEEALSDGTDTIFNYINILENEFIRKQNREISHTMDSKYRQYCNLIEKNPELFKLVPLKQIASYLGVTPQTISRFRNNCYEKGEFIC